MAAVTVLVIAVVFMTGAIIGVVLLVSLASCREDRRPKLSREAPDRITTAARLLTRLHVRRPGDGVQYQAGRRAAPYPRLPADDAELAAQEPQDC
jgi:hypothetical protein